MIDLHHDTFGKGMRSVEKSPHPSFAPLDFDEVSVRLGNDFRTDAWDCLAASNVGRRSRRPDTSFRHFLGWLVARAQEGGADAALLSGLFSGSSKDVGSLQGHLLVGRVFRSWWDWLLAGSFSSTTARTYAVIVADLLELLGQIPDRTYPRFDRDAVAIPHGTGDVGTLGALPWSELDDLPTPAARDGKALSLVKEDALSLFAELVEVFERGQSIIRNDHDARTDPIAYASVQQWLLSAKAVLRRGGNLRDLGWSRSGGGKFPHSLKDARAWIRAGIPAVYVNRLEGAGLLDSPQFVVTHLVMPSLGPTPLSSLLFAKAFAAETGWNRQPIFDLPRQPVVFRSQSHVGVSSQAVWAAAFKARAGHEVVARLEAGALLPDADGKAIWALTADDLGRRAEADGRAILSWDQGSPRLGLVDAISMQQRLADALSDYPAARRYEERLLAYLTPTGPGLDAATSGKCKFVPGTLSLRPGTGFRPIRKTYLDLSEIRAGSSSAMTAVSGTRTTGVLMRNYLNGQSLRESREVSIRLTQEVIQAHLVDAAGAGTIDIAVPPEERRMYLAVGRLTGLSVALGLLHDEAPATSPILRFTPGPDQLMSLYVIHRELRLSRGRIGPRRWAVQAAPVLALAKAIGRRVFQGNLGSVYFAQARKAHQMLRSGRLTPPAIFPRGDT